MALKGSATKGTATDAPAGDAVTTPETTAPATPKVEQGDVTTLEVKTPTAEQVAAHADKAARDQAEAKGQDPSTVPTHLKVRNIRKVGRRQPSTGLWVGENDEAYLLNDGWLDNQLRAKLLEIVE